MTLVVADIWPSGRVRVVADLRVTDAHELRRGYPSAVLKNVILGPQMVVAFAGNVALATHTLRSLPSRPGEADAVLSALLEASKLGGSGKSGVDFIVAVGDQGLWCVTNKGVESDQTSAWLGDVQAFDLYQQAYHGTSVAEPIRVPGISPAGAIPIDAQELEGLIRMSNALTSLQFDRSVESVGEAFVTATSSKDGFRYEAQVYLAADHEQVITGAQWVPADWGTVATGGLRLLRASTDRVGYWGDRLALSARGARPALSPLGAGRGVLVQQGCARRVSGRRPPRPRYLDRRPASSGRVLLIVATGDARHELGKRLVARRAVAMRVGRILAVSATVVVRSPRSAC